MDCLGLGRVFLSFFPRSKTKTKTQKFPLVEIFRDRAKKATLACDRNFDLLLKKISSQPNILTPTTYASLLDSLSSSVCHCSPPAYTKSSLTRFGLCFTDVVKIPFPVWVCNLQKKRQSKAKQGARLIRAKSQKPAHHHQTSKIATLHAPSNTTRIPARNRCSSLVGDLVRSHRYSASLPSPSNRDTGVLDLTNLVRTCPLCHTLIQQAER